MNEEWVLFLSSVYAILIFGIQGVQNGDDKSFILILELKWKCVQF